MLKVDEELNELKNAIKNSDNKNIEEEIGDLLITVVNIARFFNVSAELALKKTNKKFYKSYPSNFFFLHFLLSPNILKALLKINPQYFAFYL